MIEFPAPEKIIIATDMDGTLLARNGTIPPCNLEAIQRFRHAGGRFTLSTGRYKGRLGELFPHHEDYIDVPVISCNGAYMYDAKTGESVFELPHKSEWVVPLLHKITEKFGDVYETYIVVKADGAPRGMPYDKSIEDDYEYYKVVFGSGIEQIEALRVFIEENSSGYFLNKSSPYSIEILDPNGTKGTCVNLLRKMYDDAFIIGVGDYENDLCMLNAADAAACPENASDEVKAACGIHLCHCNDGVINDLVNLILKNERTVK